MPAHKNSLPELAFAIHDLNQRGGQDRSTLEIIEALAARRRVSAHAFTFEPSIPHSPVVFRPVKPTRPRPALLKLIIFHLATLWRFRRGEALICATGACSLVSDVIHVQFVHRSWARRPERERSLYHRLLRIYNLVTEWISFRPHKTYVAISAGVRRELELEYGLSRVVVVHHGVDAKRFSPPNGDDEKLAFRRKLGLGEESRAIFLYVGTYERKGLSLVIAAMARLMPQFRKGVLLVAVGAGDRAAYAERARRLGISEQAIFLPPHPRIEDVFRAADAFVLPTAYEPFGLVILEAMASGLACVVSAQAGAAELIRHGESGLLLQNPHDEAELAARLAELTDLPLRERLGSAARTTALTRSWARVAQEFEAAVNSVGR
jgi:UDP-glucose:(heptosyl)LPS alpha-1,3-glucosyltransferase